MESESIDSFEAAARKLERIAQMKAAGVLEDGEYQELRAHLMSTLVRSVQPEEAQPQQVPGYPREHHHHDVPYGIMHARIVRTLTAGFQEAAEDPKSTALRAIAAMADHRALHPGDVAPLTELSDVVFADLSEEDAASPSGGGSGELLERLRIISEIAARVRADRASSPAAKAITETAQQSTGRAAEELKARRAEPAGTRSVLASFWRKWVVKDVLGAFTGGSAASDVAVHFAPLLPGAVPLISALGVVVGAGVMSASSHAE